jgi:hypothetical protein
MNLSCGQCKRIQPFSGEPPKCDVCGWVCGTKTPATENSSKSQSFGEPIKDYARVTQTPKASKSSDNFEGLGCLLALVVVAAIGFGVYYFIFMPDKDYLSSKYNVSAERVNAAPKPHGCDFDDAPLGNKHCHYDKHVYVFDQKGKVIETDGTPQTCPTGCGPAYSVEQVFERVQD